MVKNLSLFGNKGKDFFTIQQIIYYSFLSLVAVFILFFATARRKEPKEAPPTAFFPLKLTHVFLSAARRSLRSLCGAALLTKNFPEFLHAPKMRSE